MSEEKRLSGLYAKMAAVMGRLERIPKRGFNQHFKYEFVTDSDVLDAVRIAMAAEGVCLFVSMTGVQQQDKRTIINFQFTFADGESGQSMPVAWVGEAIDTQDKGIAKAATSALKYCLLKTFLISTGDEPDTDSDGPQVVTAPSKPRPPTPPEAAQALPPDTEDWLVALMDDANAALAERGFEPHYKHAIHIKNTLKGLGYTSYKPTEHEEYVTKLVARVESKQINEEDGDEGQLPF